MKKINFLMVVLAALAMWTVGCKEDDDNGSGTGTGDNTLSAGNITEDMTISGNYYLDGGVHVKSGATLTIEAGTTIKAKVGSSVSYLLIEPGAKIMAEGTAENPIVFTSNEENPARGDWGGIFICGNAPSNKPNTTEIGDVAYGGTTDKDAEDNSGVLKYIRLEYTGFAFTSEKESNGFSFCAVGSGTTVEYLQVYKGADDGFEFYGGTVNTKYLVSTGSKDDSFDWTDGWVGKNQFWIAQQEEGNGDNGFECDNNSSDNTAEPISNPTIYNVTLIGGGDGSRAMKLRVGTKGILKNVAISGFEKTVTVADSTTVLYVNNGELELDNFVSDNDPAASYAVGTGGNLDNAILEEGKGFEAGSFSADVSFLSTYVGTTTDNAATIAADDFFEATDYIGAVKSGSDWTAGWTKGL